MGRVSFIWDLEDDPARKLLAHLLIEETVWPREEVEEVSEGNHETSVRSCASGQPVAFWMDGQPASTSRSALMACPTTLRAFTPSQPTKLRRPVPESEGRSDEGR